MWSSPRWSDRLKDHWSRFLLYNVEHMQGVTGCHFTQCPDGDGSVSVLILERSRPLDRRDVPSPFQQFSGAAARRLVHATFVVCRALPGAGAASIPEELLATQRPRNLSEPLRPWQSAGEPAYLTPPACGRPACQWHA